MAADLVIIKRTDIASETEMYVGWAAAGSPASAPKWRIKRILLTSTSATELWADGNTAFDNIWDNRASLAYS